MLFNIITQNGSTKKSLDLNRPVAELYDDSIKRLYYRNEYLEPKNQLKHYFSPFLPNATVYDNMANQMPLPFDIDNDEINELYMEINGLHKEIDKLHREIKSSYTCQKNIIIVGIYLLAIVAIPGIIYRI